MALFDRKASSLNSLKRTDPEIDEVMVAQRQRLQGPADVGAPRR